MARCVTCNWHPHDVSIHGETCSNGHPLEVVGRTHNGSCKRCRAERAKRYADRDRDRERARCRMYHAIHRTAIIARKRSKRSYRAVVGQRRGHRGIEGAPPPSAHPWRATNASPEAAGDGHPGGRSVAGPATAGGAGAFPATTKEER